MFALVAVGLMILMVGYLVLLGYLVFSITGPKPTDSASRRRVWLLEFGIGLSGIVPLLIVSLRPFFLPNPDDPKAVFVKIIGAVGLTGYALIVWGSSLIRQKSVEHTSGGSR